MFCIAGPAANVNRNLLVYGQQPKQELARGDTIRMFDWNTHKFTDPKALLAVASYAQRANLILLQESMMGEQYAGYFSSLDRMRWYNAKSWVKGPGLWTGVATGSAYEVTDAVEIRSQAREPILHTPKMIVLTEIPIRGSDETLLVVNIHAINFVTTSAYRTQIAQLQQAIQSHKGPMIVAGDFNMYSIGRAIAVHKMAEAVGLQYVWLQNDNRVLRLDHLLVRGLTVKTAEVLNQQKGSDHLPLWAELELQ